MKGGPYYEGFGSISETFSKKEGLIKNIFQNQEIFLKRVLMKMGGFIEQRIVIPNDQVFKSVVVNESKLRAYRIDMYIETPREVLQEITSKSILFLYS